MKRLVALLAAAVALLAPAAAAAHPLGNFTVNRFSAVELSGGRIYVKQVLDLAEIPTFQEGARVRRPAFARELAGKLVLEVDGRRAPLRLLASDARLRPGTGGLKTLRLEAVYESTLTGRSLRFRDTAFGSRIGWREIVVRAENGARLESASVPATSASDELRAYPQDLLSEPLDVDSASATFRLGSGAGSPPEVDGKPSAPHAAGGFENLIVRDDLGLGVIALSLLVAAFWGAAHALTPGHGKAIVAGYLVGSRGKPRHAVALGLIVTVTHTAGVFALGLVTLGLSAFVVPEQLYPWLTLASGLLVVGVGASVLVRRARHRRAHAHGHHHHHHDHGYGRGGLLGVGVAAGLLPCPSALVVLLSAIALHRVALGLALIVAFSVGLAATITAIGLVAVLARRAFGLLRLDGRLVHALPAVSALVVLLVGLGITVNSIPEVL
ncbi:MAG TPA: sulfite exporter TauE/SafE family protein [Gaiellaceae bacterium]|nr:sulfite exporter TauE/SafE family protein [Gaiellaceae bacterium]